MEWSLYVLIIKLLVHCSAEDVQYLKFTITRDTSPEGGGDLVCSGDILNIELNKTYKIRIDYPADSTVYRRARWGLQNDNMQDIIMFTGNSNYAESAVFTASVTGSLSYKGVFFTHICDNIKNGTCNYNLGIYLDYGVTCQTTMNVLNPGETINLPEASLAVNTQTFSTSGSEQDYYYHDGQGTMFTCTRTVGHCIQLSFTTLASRFESTGWQNYSSLSMYVKLTSSLSGTKLQCLVAGDRGYQRNITLNLMLAKAGLTAFRVNGMIPILRYQSNCDYYYEYIFRDDEDLTVQLIKDNAKFPSPSSCYAEGSNVPYKLKQFFDMPGMVDQNHLDKVSITFPLSYGGNETAISCTLQSIPPPVQYCNYTVKFIYTNLGNSPNFFDLSMANIVLNYWNNTGNQLEYEVYSPVAKSLFCASCKDSDRMKLSDYDKFLTSFDNSCKLITQLELKPDQDEASMLCISRNVRVIRKKITTPPLTEYTSHHPPFNTGHENVYNLSTTVPSSSVIPSKQMDATTNKIEASSNTPLSKKVDSYEDEKLIKNSGGSDSGSPWLLAFSVAVVILLVAAALWLAYNYSKKRRLRKQNPEVDYQNLPEHLEGPMATPTQWDNRPDDVTYSHPVIENLYTVPTAKANRPKRQNIEPVYSQPRDSNIAYENTGVGAMELNNEAGYAEVGQNEPAYASVGQNGPTYAEAGPAYTESGPTYAEAGPTYALVGQKEPSQLTGPTYASVQKATPPQDTYAQVQKKHEKMNQTKGHYQNANLDTKVLPQVNYANVHNLKPEYCGYVNGGVKDDVEPAYSELSQNI